MRCFVFVEGRIIALKITAFKVERRSSFGSQFSFLLYFQHYNNFAEKMLSSHSVSWRISYPRILYRLVLLSSRVFSPQRNLILFISFPWNGHQQSIFCLLVSKTPAETIDCVTECLTYDILQLYCIKFHVSSFTPISDHIAVGSVGLCS